jgi:hypothetical protein
VSLSSLPTPQITSPSTSTYIPYEIQRRFPLPPATLGAIFSSSAVSNSVRLDSSAAHPPTGVASACNRNLSSPHVESILLILTCLFRPIYHTSLVLISPVLVLLIGADSHQRGTAPVPPRLQTSFTLRPLPLHCFFHARPSASAVLLFALGTFLVRLTRRIQSAVAIMLAKSSSHFPASASGLLILCLSYPLSARSADPRLLVQSDSAPRLSDLAAAPLRAS